MIKMTSLKLAAAFAAVSFFSQAQACKLHITNVSGGFYSPHPLSIPVSVATREAIDANILSDIPRKAALEKMAALDKIEGRLVRILLPQNLYNNKTNVSFSLFLTESNHWVNFVEKNGKLRIKIHQSSLEQFPTVIVMSDTALKNILDQRLKVIKALKLGVLQVSVSGEESVAAIEHLKRIIQKAS